MKKLLSAVIAFTLVAPALAQLRAAEDSGHHAATSAAPSADMTDGEIRKVDKAAGRITIRHGEIRNLDMPAMTMVFQVKDKARIDTLQPGDKVKFKATNDAGTLTATEIQPAAR